MTTKTKPKFKTGQLVKDKNRDNSFMVKDIMWSHDDNIWLYECGLATWYFVEESNLELIKGLV